MENKAKAVRDYLRQLYGQDTGMVYFYGRLIDLHDLTQDDIDDVWHFLKQ